MVGPEPVDPINRYINNIWWELEPVDSVNGYVNIK